MVCNLIMLLSQHFIYKVAFIVEYAAVIMNDTAPSLYKQRPPISYHCLSLQYEY